MQIEATAIATALLGDAIATNLFMLGYERNELVHMLNEANQLIESLRNELDALKEELNK